MVSCDKLVLCETNTSVLIGYALHAHAKSPRIPHDILGLHYPAKVRRVPRGKCLFSGCGFDLICRAVKVIVFHKLYDALIAKSGELRIKRKSGDNGNAAYLVLLLAAEHADSLTAIGAGDIRHILDIPITGMFISPAILTAFSTIMETRS